MTPDQHKTVTLDHRNADLLMGVPLQISAELGNCRMMLADILKLSTGSLIELDRPASGPVDLRVNGKLVARGDIVAIDENLGVHVTELICKHE